MPPSPKRESLAEQFWRLRACPDNSSRSELLEQIRDQSPEVATELERMLRAEAALGSFLELREPVTACGATSGESVTSVCDFRFEPGSTHAPSSLGPYKILEPIGEGGMGIVYLALQSHPVRRKVAIKVIKPGMDSRQVIARFEAERQALAMMNHPNIAKILDAGTTATGLPYFVMELVQGIPLTEYCDQAQMEIDERLRLFQSTCDAVQHAHNKGVIHRDLKPSNILVTECDGKARVKVIDFGVAKALNNTLTEKTLYTGLFQIMGTPLYMSPEQASFSSSDIDTRSDVYSLGVLLYELISGTRPFEREDISEMSLELLRHHICDTEPLRPSRRLSTLKDRCETIAQRRQISVSQLFASISKELDWIVMRAIEKDCQRRYQSTRELSDDIERYLNGESVNACPPTLLYRSRKFVSRNRALLITLTGIAAILVIATIVSTWQAVKASRATRLAEHHSQLAEEKSAQLSELVYHQDMVAASRYFLDGDQDRVNQLIKRHESPLARRLYGFEWYFIKSLLPVATRVMHKADHAINDFVLTADGRRYVIADSGGNVCWIDRAVGNTQGTIKVEQGVVYDIESSSDDQVFTCGESGDVWCFRWKDALERLVPVKQVSVCNVALYSLAVSNDAKTLWAGSRDGRVFEIDVATGEQALIFDVARVASSAIRDLELFGENKLLLAQGAELICLTLNERDLNGRPSIHWMHAPERAMSHFRDIELSLNNGVIAAGQLFGSVTLFRDATPRPQIEFSQLMTADVHSVALSPDGRWLAVGDSVGVIHLIPTDIDRRGIILGRSEVRKRRTTSWRAHGGKIRQLKFVQSSDGDEMPIIVSVSRDQQLVVSHPFSAAPTQYFDIGESASLSTTPDIAAGILWADLTYGVNLKSEHRWSQIHSVVQVEEQLDCVEVQDAGQVGLLLDRQTLLLVPKSQDNAAPLVLWTASDQSFAPRYAISSDASHFALCIQHSGRKTHQIEIYKSGQSFPLHVIDSNLAYDMTFSPDGTQLAYTFNDEIAIVEVSSGERLHLLQHHIDSIYDLAYSPDGRQLASVSGDRTLAVWDVNFGRLRWSELAHENRSYALAFHPTLETIATVGADSMVRFWSTRATTSDNTNRLAGEFPLDEGNCSEIAFADGGQTLVIRHGDHGISRLRGQFDSAD